jgi:hypothetical protein
MHSLTHWAPEHGGVEGHEDVNALAREGSNGPFVCPEPAVPLSPCVGRFKVKQRHSKHWPTAPLARRTLSDELSRPVTGLLTGHCTLRRHLHIMGLSE